MRKVWIFFGALSVVNESLSDQIAKEQLLKILLIVSDTALEPSLTNTATEIKVTIGINDDFDQILDVCSGILDTEQIAHLHRLWADDAFPRDFNRTGDELIITARE